MATAITPEKEKEEAVKTAAAAATETKVETPPPQLTEAELEQQRDLLVRRTFGMAEPKEPEQPAETDAEKAEREKKEKEAADAAAKAEQEKQEKAKPAPKAKAEEKPKAKTKPKLPKLPEPEEEEELVERVAAKVAEKVAPKVAPEKPAVEQTPALSSKAKKTIEIMEAMGKSNPVYRDLASQTQQFWKKEAAYAEKWEKDNPGQVFNREADEHDDFYKKQEPAFDEEEFDETRVALVAERIAEQKVAERTKPLAEAQKVRDTQAKMAQEAPEVESVCYEAEKDTFRKIAPELAELLTKDGKFELDPETVARVKEEDPVAAKVLEQTADKLGLCVREIERLTRYPDAYTLQPDWNVKLKTTGETFYPHKAVHDTAVHLEAQLAALPPEESEIDGKKFLTMDAWSGRLKRIVDSSKSDPEKQAEFARLNASYYRLTSDLIIERLSNDLARDARRRMKEYNELTDLRLKKNGAAAAQTAPVAETKKEGVIKERKNPPAAASSSAQPDKPVISPQNDEERLALAEQRLF